MKLAALNIERVLSKIFTDFTKSQFVSLSHDFLQTKLKDSMSRRKSLMFVPSKNILEDRPTSEVASSKIHSLRNFALSNIMETYSTGDPKLTGLVPSMLHLENLNSSSDRGIVADRPKKELEGLRHAKIMTTLDVQDDSDEDPDQGTDLLPNKLAQSHAASTGHFEATQRISPNKTLHSNQSIFSQNSARQVLNHLISPHQKQSLEGDALPESPDLSKTHSKPQPHKRPSKSKAVNKSGFSASKTLNRNSPDTKRNAIADDSASMKDIPSKKPAVSKKPF
jgi:hypothetical protein